MRPANPFNYQAYGALRPLRRVGDICRKQEDIALSNSFTLPFSFAIYVFKNNVPLYLEEELVGGVYVEISTSIRASNGHDHEFGVLPNHLSPYWRLKKMAMLFNPAFQIKGSKRLCHVTSLQKMALHLLGYIVICLWLYSVHFRHLT